MTKTTVKSTFLEGINFYASDLPLLRALPFLEACPTISSTSAKRFACAGLTVL
jgi:hypothetical protein